MEGAALPPGVLALVFEYLSPTSRLQARRVCRDWRGAVGIGCAHLHVEVNSRPASSGVDSFKVGRVRLRGRRSKLSLERDDVDAREATFDSARWLNRTRGHLPQPIVLDVEQVSVPMSGCPIPSSARAPFCCGSLPASAPRAAAPPCPLHAMARHRCDGAQRTPRPSEPSPSPPPPPPSLQLVSRPSAPASEMPLRSPSEGRTHAVGADALLHTPFGEAGDLGERREGGAKMKECEKRRGSRVAWRGRGCAGSERVVSELARGSAECELVRRRSSVLARRSSASPSASAVAAACGGGWGMGSASSSVTVLETRRARPELRVRLARHIGRRGTPSGVWCPPHRRYHQD